MLIDTHAHLAMLEHTSVDEAISRASVAGVEKIITVSTDEASWEKNRDIALKNPNIYYTVGLHPHDSMAWEGCKNKLEDWFKVTVPKCVAIGEMGLDFYYDHSPKESQITALEGQLLLAKKVGLPVVIHCREAFEALYASIKKVGLGDKKGVLHCFTGTEAEALEGVSLGLKISFSGIFTFKNAQHLRDIAKKISLSNIVIETDCPFLAPIPYRGKPNEPSFLPLTAQALSDAVGKELSDISLQTSQNAIKFFGL